MIGFCEKKRGSMSFSIFCRKSGHQPRQNATTDPTVKPKNPLSVTSCCRLRGSGRWWARDPLGVTTPTVGWCFLKVMLWFFLRGKTGVCYTFQTNSEKAHRRVMTRAIRYGLSKIIFLWSRYWRDANVSICQLAWAHHLQPEGILS